MKSPLQNNNFLLAVDNSKSAKNRLPPTGLNKGHHRSNKEFPVSANTFFKTATPAEKGFKVNGSPSKRSRSVKKFGQT